MMEQMKLDDEEEKSDEAKTDSKQADQTAESQ